MLHAAVAVAHGGENLTPACHIPCCGRMCICLQSSTGDMAAARPTTITKTKVRIKICQCCAPDPRASQWEHLLPHATTGMGTYTAPMQVCTTTVRVELKMHAKCVCCPLQFSTYIDRSNLSFAAFQFKADIHMSNTIYGLGASIFFVGYTVSQVRTSKHTQYWPVLHCLPAPQGSKDYMRGSRVMRRTRYVVTIAPES